MNFNLEKAAVFIDYENINTTDSYNPLFSKLIKEGYNPIIRKIICSTIPKKSNFSEIIKDNLLDFIVSYKHLKKGTSKITKEKNLNNADFRVYIEVLKTLYTNKDINTFVIATSDDDYTELICTLKSEGKYLIGVGNKTTTSTSYKELFNKFYFIEDIMAPQTIENEVISNDKVETKKKENKKTLKPKKETKNSTKKTQSSSNQKKQNTSTKKKQKDINKNKSKVELIKKEEVISTTKNQIFYSVLKNSIEEELKSVLAKGNEKSYFISNLISKIKSESPYLKNFKKISADDIEKCGFKIEYENGELVKGYLTPQKK